MLKNLKRADPEVARFSYPDIAYHAAGRLARLWMSSPAGRRRFERGYHAFRHRFRDVHRRSDDHFRETFIDVMSLKASKFSVRATASTPSKTAQQSHPSVIIMDVQLPDVRPDLPPRQAPGRLSGHAIVFVSASTKYADPATARRMLATPQFLPSGRGRLWSDQA